MRLRNTPYEYVQIAESDLPRIQLRHLSSAIDPSISLPESLADIPDVLTGYTERTGRWQEKGLTIGWDWAFSNERIHLIHADEIRIAAIQPGVAEKHPLRTRCLVPGAAMAAMTADMAVDRGGDEVAAA